MDDQPDAQELGEAAEEAKADLMHEVLNAEQDEAMASLARAVFAARKSRDPIFLVLEISKAEGAHAKLLRLAAEEGRNLPSCKIAEAERELGVARAVLSEIDEEVRSKVERTRAFFQEERTRQDEAWRARCWGVYTADHLSTCSSCRCPYTPPASYMGNHPLCEDCRGDGVRATRYRRGYDSEGDDYDRYSGYGGYDHFRD